MTQEQTLAEKIKNFKKKSGYKYTEIAENANVKLANLYKWKDGTSPTDQEEYLRLLNYLDGNVESKTGKMESKPSTDNPPTDQKLTDTKKDTLDKDVLKMVAQSNLNQSEANKNQSIANRKLAESISVLTHQFTGGGSSEIREEMAQKFADLILIIQKLATGQPIDEDLSTFWSVEKSKNVSSDNSLAG